MIAASEKKTVAFQADSSYRKKAKDERWEWVNHPTIAQRNRWVEENLGLARKYAHKWHKNSCLPYEDIEQAAFIGLIRATERFDKSKGCAFSTFAVPRIIGEIKNYFRDKGHSVKVPRKFYDEWQRAKRIEKLLINKLQRNPTDREIAFAMGVTTEALLEARTAMINCKRTSSEESLKYKEKEGVRLRAEMALRADCSRMTDRQVQIVDLYFSSPKAATILGIPQLELLKQVRVAIGLVAVSAEV